MVDDIRTMPKSNKDLESPMRPMTPPSPPRPTSPTVSSVSSHGESGWLSKLIFALVGFVVGAALLGAGMYFWLGQTQAQTLADQKAGFDQEKTVLSNQVSSLQSELSDVQQNLKDLALPSSSPNIQIENSDVVDPGKEKVSQVVIKIDNETIQTVTNTGLNFELPIEGRIFKTFPQATYIEIKQQRGEAVTFYDMQSVALYKLDHKAKTLTSIVLPETLPRFSAYDISNDQKLAALTSEGKIHIFNMETKEMKDFNLPDNFISAGDLLFSPNNQMLAFTAAKGPSIGSINSSIYIIDLENNIIDKIRENPSTASLIYHIDRWNGNSKDLISYYYFPR